LVITCSEAGASKRGTAVALPLNVAQNMAFAGFLNVYDILVNLLKAFRFLKSHSEAAKVQYGQLIHSAK